MIKTAVLPAAGKGKRLRPLTDDRPKALIEVRGKTLIEWIIKDLLDLGIERIIVITGYLGHKIKEALKNYDVEFVEQEEQLGTAHALGTVFFLKEPFLVVNSDLFVSKKNLKKLLDSYEEGVLIGAEEVENAERYGALKVEGNKVKLIVEKSKNPPSNLINGGLYVFNPKIFEYIEKTGLSTRGEFEITDSIQMMANELDNVYFVLLDGYRIGVTRPEDLDFLNSNFEKFRSKN